MRFVENRRKAGKWRDFEDDSVNQEVLKKLNVAARAGAADAELRSIMNMGGQPEAFKERLQESERAYRAFGALLASAVAERITLQEVRR
jgi:ribosomal protein L34E